MAQQWFKFYGGDYLSDPKIERLSPLERSCWITILCMASMGKDGLIEFLTVESLLNRSGIRFDPYQPEEWENALSVLTKFKKLNMIEMTDDGCIIVKNCLGDKNTILLMLKELGFTGKKRSCVTKTSRSVRQTSL